MPPLPPQPSRLEALPDNCIGQIMSWHGPRDLAAVSTSSRAFFGAARHDVLWLALWLAMPGPSRVAGAAAGRPFFEACARAHESARDATRRWAAETAAALAQRFGLAGACSRVVRALGVQLDLRLFEANAKSVKGRAGAVVVGGTPLPAGASPPWCTFALGSSLHHAPTGGPLASPAGLGVIEVVASIGMAAPPPHRASVAEEALKVTLLRQSGLQRCRWSERLVSLSKDGATALYCFRGPSVSGALDYGAALLIAVSIDRSRLGCLPDVGPPLGRLLFLHGLLPHARLAAAFAPTAQRHRSAALGAALAAAAGNAPTAVVASEAKAAARGGQRGAAVRRETISVAVSFRTLTAVLWECTFTRRRFTWQDDDDEATGAPAGLSGGRLLARRDQEALLPPAAPLRRTATCALLADEAPGSGDDDARRLSGPARLALGACSFEGSAVVDLAAWDDSSGRVLWAASAPVAVRAASAVKDACGRPRRAVRALVLEEAQGWLWAELVPTGSGPAAALRVEALSLALHLSSELAPTSIL